MTINDYMSFVYTDLKGIINSKKDGVFLSVNISPMKINNELFYKVERFNEYGELEFFYRFPCQDKIQFYNALNSIFINYYFALDKFAYSTIEKNNESCCLGIYTSNYIKLSIKSESDHDIEFFEAYAEYLNQRLEVNETNINDSILVKK